MLNSQQLLKLEEMGLMTQVKRMECKDHLKKEKIHSEVMLEYANGDRKIVLLNDHHPFEVSTGVGLTTITDYFVRGDYGKASYRGNCTGLLVKDLLTYFKPQFFMDLCKGSGTA